MQGCCCWRDTILPSAASQLSLRSHLMLYCIIMQFGVSTAVTRFVALSSLVELAAKSIQQELQHSKSQEDAWNNSAIELVRSSDVSSPERSEVCPRKLSIRGVVAVQQQ